MCFWHTHWLFTGQQPQPTYCSQRSTNTNLLVFKGLAKLYIVCECSHCYGQFANDLEVDGSFVSRGNEGVHPPVGGFGQQVNEGLQEANAEVLKVFGRLHLCWIGETHVALWQKEELWLTVQFPLVTWKLRVNSKNHWLGFKCTEISTNLCTADDNYMSAEKTLISGVNYSSSSTGCLIWKFMTNVKFKSWNQALF